jgi:hypothetical protein
MDTSTLFTRLDPHIPKTQLSFAARLATITRRRSRNNSGGDLRNRASSDHELLRAPRTRGPTRRLCAIGSCRAQTYGRRVSRRRRRVRVRIYLLPFPPVTRALTWPVLGFNQIRDDAWGGRCRFAHDVLRLCPLRVARGLVLHRSVTRIILYPPLSCACPILPSSLLPSSYAV